jgi:EAL domain-containing protein (putative c-di-GMP-specific phosphodiesterase class I)
VAVHAELYRILVERQGDRWLAHVPALPGRTAEGKTPDAARDEMHKALTAHLFGSASGGMWSRQRESLGQGLRQALAGREFRLHYQPTFQLATGELVGMEALVRWDHPLRGLIAPRDFIPEAEATGLTPFIDDWVLDEACRQLRDWQSNDPVWQAFVMSVNLSRGQLHRPDLAQRVIRVIDANGLEPGRLRLEVPETTAIEEDEAAARNFEALRAAGIHLAVDDVSAERSSLARLRGLTVDSLKIDRPLVNELGEGSRTTSLVQAITLLAHAWGMTVTAEGVETAQQAATLQALGCDFAQGFYYGKPVPSDQAGRLLR